MNTNELTNDRRGSCTLLTPSTRPRMLVFSLFGIQTLDVLKFPNVEQQEYSLLPFRPNSVQSVQIRKGAFMTSRRSTLTRHRAVEWGRVLSKLEFLLLKILQFFRVHFHNLKFKFI